MVEGACRHLTVFHVADVNNRNPASSLPTTARAYMALVGKYAKARQRKPEHLAELRDLVEEANHFADFFGLRARLTLPDDLTGHDCRMSSNREEGTGAEATGRAQSGNGKRGSACRSGLTGRSTTARPVTVNLSGCGSRGTNCRLRAARGFPLHMPSRLSGLSSACTIRGKPISATGILSTLDTSPLIPLTPRATYGPVAIRWQWAEIARVATLAGVN